VVYWPENLATTDDNYAPFSSQRRMAAYGPFFPFRRFVGFEINLLQGPTIIERKAEPAWLLSPGFTAA
jgi:hypothetical protein